MPDSVQIPTMPSSLFEFTQALRHAIRDELNARKTPSNGKPLSVPLCDGHVQGRFGRHQRVTFRSPLMPLQDYLQDTQGELVIDGRPHPCVILGLTLDQLTLSLTADLQDYIPEARLSVDRMRLLLALDKRLANIQAHPQDYLTSLAMKCFGTTSLPNPLPVQATIAPDPSLNPEQFDALLRAMSHDFAYIWGPPGTGKTLVIGACAHVAFTRGQRILIAANTNSAVDQALESVLARLPHAPTGAIIRYGLHAEDAAPTIKPVTLDHLAAGVTGTLEQQIATLRTEEARLADRLRGLEALVAQRRDLDALDQRIQALQRTHDTLQTEAAAAHDTVTQATTAHTHFSEELETYWRASAWRRLLLRRLPIIQADLLASRLVLEDAAQMHQEIRAQQQQTELAITDLLTTRRLFIENLPAQLSTNADASIETDVQQHQHALRTIQDHLAAVQRELLQLETRLIQQAKIVATTLTRTYSAPLLERERFDLVIIDEGSMASPPALFTALCLATTQVIIVGDFLQLPPIAEATTLHAQQWLATDVYKLARVSHDHDPRVAALRTQYRMHPDIAAVAARLYQRSGLDYRTDQHIRLMRQPLVDQAPVPGKALAFIDTSDRSCWIEKDYKGSPSNRTHAALAVQLAQDALDADPSHRPTISIISPYRHQVRVIQELLQQAQLTSHVEVGTIHSFQGRQSDIVIFDTTVTGDLTRTMLGRCVGDHSPCKLMNVAFTRGKSKLLILAHRPSLSTLVNVPNSLLWDAFQLATAQHSIIPSRRVSPTGSPVATPPTPDRVDTHEPSPPTTRALLAPVIPLKRRAPKLYLIRHT